jgi:iron complex transport system substrate-binding protein
MKITTFGIAIMTLCVSLGFLPATASDFTLEIFGNANMDDTIDELDIEYVQGIIDGTNEPTQFADANYDGLIDEKDIDRIKDIISRTEKELTLIDTARRTVTVHKPINRMIEIGFTSTEVLRLLKVESEKIVGVGDYTLQKKAFFPEFNESQNVGTSSSPNYELILELQPDLIILYAAGHSIGHRLRIGLNSLADF